MTRDVVVRLLLGERTKILAFVRSIVAEHQLAEDVFQEVSVLAVERCSEIEGERHFLGWVRNVARFKALKARRQQRTLPLLLEDDVLELLDGDWARLDEQPAGELHDRLARCMQRLTPNARRLLDLKYVDGLSGASIAERLGRQLRSVYTALSRIHGALTACLEGRATDEGLVDG